MIIAAIGIAAITIGAVYAAIWAERKLQEIEATLDSKERQREWTPARND